MTYAAIRQVMAMKAQTPFCQAHTHPNSKRYPKTTKPVTPMILHARTVIASPTYPSVVNGDGSVRNTWKPRPPPPFEVPILGGVLT